MEQPNQLPAAPENFHELHKERREARALHLAETGTPWAPRRAAPEPEAAAAPTDAPAEADWAENALRELDPSHEADRRAAGARRLLADLDRRAATFRKGFAVTGEKTVTRKDGSTVTESVGEYRSPAAREVKAAGRLDALSRQVSRRADSLYAVREAALVRGAQLARKGSEQDAVDTRAATEARRYAERAADDLRALESGSETWRAARMATLDRYRRELAEGGFARTPSRRDDFEWLVGASVGPASRALLVGPTGTGKTEHAHHFSRAMWGEPPTVIRGTDETRQSEVEGKTGLRASNRVGEDDLLAKHATLDRLVARRFAETGAPQTPEAEAQVRAEMLALVSATVGVTTETFDVPGKYGEAAARAKAKGGAVLLWDEFNNSPKPTRLGLKERYNRLRADGIFFVATANLKSDKHPDRDDLDDAERREFIGATRQVGYLPREELYDAALARLSNARGSIRAGADELASVLKNFCDAVADTQAAYQNRLGQAYLPNAKGEANALRKNVLDPGAALRMLDGYDASGTTLHEFLSAKARDYVLQTLQQNDRDSAEDRKLIATVFATQGFDLGPEAPVDRATFAPKVAEAAARWRAAAALRGPAARLPLAELALLDPYGLRAAAAASSADEALAGAPPAPAAPPNLPGELPPALRAAMEANGVDLERDVAASAKMYTEILPDSTRRAFEAACGAPPSAHEVAARLAAVPDLAEKLATLPSPRVLVTPLGLDFRVLADAAAAEIAGARAAAKLTDAQTGGAIQAPYYDSDLGDPGTWLYFPTSFGETGHGGKTKAALLAEDPRRFGWMVAVIEGQPELGEVPAGRRAAVPAGTSPARALETFKTDATHSGERGLAPEELCWHQALRAREGVLADVYQKNSGSWAPAVCIPKAGRAGFVPDVGWNRDDRRRRVGASSPSSVYSDVAVRAGVGA